MIVIFNSYLVNVGLVIEVVIVLYKIGVLLLIYDVEKFLRILCEEGYVWLIFNLYYNYMGY